MSDAYDLIVIGGGPGGYVAAIRAAQLGMKTACVEMRGSLGGTCLNVGCIPSKHLLHASHAFEEATHSFAHLGIKTGGVELDLKQMLASKDEVVTSLTSGIEFLFKKNKVDYIKGLGRIAGQGKVIVMSADGKEATLTTTNILIATGSESTPLPGVEVDEKKIVTSTGALELKKTPKKMIVIGGGVIGLEMGVVWRRLGAEVEVIEYLDKILPTMDGEVSKQMQRIMKKAGFTFRLSTKVTGAKTTRSGVTLTVEPAKGGAAEDIKADIVLVAIGRRPYTEGLGLEKAGVELDRGKVKINAHYQTNVEGIWAIGDVVDGPMLAHKAEDEGMIAVEIMAGQASHMDYDCIPSVVYTWPEIASVGRTEEQLKDQGVAYKSGKFPFQANSRARASGGGEGFVKILADAETDQVLGAHIVGPDAGTLIAEIVLAMEFGASSEDIARTCHAHPTLNEAVKEAALAVEGRQIHS
ncbi:MAG: dihydrolipoyl dehydrogenase [Alphaproteobacteria bacterium]